jgi:hypothetical protein
MESRTDHTNRKNAAGASLRVAYGIVPLLLVSLLSIGCSHTDSLKSYKNVGDNIDKIFKKVQSESDGMTIPHAEASFCLERAYTLMQQAYRNQGFDIFFLASAGATGAAGLAAGAAAGAMDDSSRRKDVAISAAILSVLPGAIFGTREAFKTYEIAKTQRIAAARNVDAAIALLERYALAEDPKDVTDDGFSTCRDGEISIANSLPGSVTSLTLKAAEEKQADAEDQKNAQDAAVEKKEAARKVKETAADAATKLASATAAYDQAITKKAASSAQLKTEMDTAKTQSDAAQKAATVAQSAADVAEKEAELKKEIIALKDAVSEAYARVRRQILYISTREELDSALQLAEDSAGELKEARERLQKLSTETAAKASTESSKPTAEPAKPMATTTP